MNDSGGQVQTLQPGQDLDPHRRNGDSGACPYLVGEGPSRPRSLRSTCRGSCSIPLVFLGEVAIVFAAFPPRRSRLLDERVAPGDRALLHQSCRSDRCAADRQRPCTRLGSSPAAQEACVQLEPSHPASGAGSDRLPCHRHRRRPAWRRRLVWNIARRRRRSGRGQYSHQQRHPHLRRRPQPQGAAQYPPARSGLGRNERQPRTGGGDGDVDPTGNSMGCGCSPDRSVSGLPGICRPARKRASGSRPCTRRPRPCSGLPRSRPPCW